MLANVASLGKPQFAALPLVTARLSMAMFRPPRADVAESVDAPDLKSVGHSSWGFESPRPHQAIGRQTIKAADHWGRDKSRNLDGDLYEKINLR